MIDIFLSTQSKKGEVIAFLEGLKELLGKEDFDIDSDLTLIKKRKVDDEEYSTPYTLLDLDYDAWDVVERLKELTESLSISNSHMRKWKGREADNGGQHIN